MKYGPRPNIENHFHIKELIDTQEKRADDRQYHKDRIKGLQERNELIKDTNQKETKAFYCETCKEDFFAESIKEVEIDWSCPMQSISFYKTKCFKGHWCMRLITDTHKDSYWFRSRRVAQDKGSHYKDTLQPHQTGFNMLYKKI